MQVKKYHSYIIILTRVKTKYRVVQICRTLTKHLRTCRVISCEQKGHKMYQHFCLPYRVNACLTGLKTVHHARISKLEPRYFFHPIGLLVSAIRE